MFIITTRIISNYMLHRYLGVLLWACRFWITNGFFLNTTETTKNSSELFFLNTTEKAENTSELLDSLLRGYDKRLRPNFGGPPDLVDVNLNIRSMGPISEQDMAYQLDCYFRQSWVDTRLSFSSTMDKLGVSVNILERLWKPDTHFFNGKKSYLHTVTTPNKLLRIYKNGRILYSMRITIKASCPMHLENFPMDTQTCPLKFGSHGYGEKDVTYIWTKGADKSIKMASDLALSQFDLIEIPAGNQTVFEIGLGGQRYSMLFAKFVLRRHMGYFLINVYVPCSLLVVISWVAFWINREATADRIALGITTVLTMAFLGIENRRDLPKVSYSTALDYFVGVCFAFVLASILQFAGVHYFTKHGSGEVFIVPESSSSSSSESEAEEPRNVIEEEPEENNHHEDEHKPLPHHHRAHPNFHRDRRMSIRACAARNHRMSFKQNGTNSPSAIPEQQERGVKYKRPNRRKAIAPRNREKWYMKLWYCVLGNTEFRDEMMRSSPEGVNSVSRIDKGSRIVFPTIFISFNAFYWYWYIHHVAGPVHIKV